MDRREANVATAGAVIAVLFEMIEESAEKGLSRSGSVNAEGALLRSRCA